MLGRAPCARVRRQPRSRCRSPQSAARDPWRPALAPPLRAADSPRTPLTVPARSSRVHPLGAPRRSTPSAGGPIASASPPPPEAIRARARRDTPRSTWTLWCVSNLPPLARDRLVSAFTSRRAMRRGVIAPGTGRTGARDRARDLASLGFAPPRDLRGAKMCARPRSLRRAPLGASRAPPAIHRGFRRETTRAVRVASRAEPGPSRVTRVRPAISRGKARASASPPAARNDARRARARPAPPSAATRRARGSRARRRDSGTPPDGRSDAPPARRPRSPRGRDPPPRAARRSARHPTCGGGGRAPWLLARIGNPAAGLSSPRNSFFAARHSWRMFPRSRPDPPPPRRSTLTHRDPPPSPPFLRRTPPGASASRLCSAAAASWTTA